MKTIAPVSAPLNPAVTAAHADALKFGARVDAKVHGVAAAFAEGSPFSHLRGLPGYESDAWKAFIEFDICHAIPAGWMGPVNIGPTRDQVFGLFGDTLAASYQSMLFQQLNFRHKLKAYAPEGAKAGKKDCIIGCVVAAAMPPKPEQGWFSPANPGGSRDAKIHGLAVVFKLADGVDDILGGHLASREEQSVSIEVITNTGNMGLYRPSANQLVELDEIPEGWWRGLNLVPGCVIPEVRKLDGEQLMVVYGMGAPVEFRGVAVTPNPAEKKLGTQSPLARITAVNAECYAAAAEDVGALVRGTPVQFDTGAAGRVLGIRTRGYAAGHRASEENPLVDIAVRGGVVELALSEVRRRVRM